MESEIRTVVTFESTAFNMITPRDYFVNPCCFGDDLAEWLIREISAGNRRRGWPRFCRLVLKRRPERMNNYRARILVRMGQMGW